MSQYYGFFPSFRVISPLRDFISEWGEIPLPRIPLNEYLHPDEKYYLLIGVGYHGITPRTEINRLVLRSLISKKFGIDWHSQTVSWLSAFYSTLEIYTALSQNHAIKSLIKEPLKYMIAILENKKYTSPLLSFVREYYRYLLKKEVKDDDIMEFVKNINEILASRIKFETKVNLFFDIIEQIIKMEMHDEKNIEKNMSAFTISLGSPYSENKKRTWGANWRVLESRENKDITPRDLKRLARVDEKSALELAKELDKKTQGDKKVDKKIKKGKLPGYSDRLRMFQRLLSQRRYIAAVRRVRMERILASIQERPLGSQQLVMRGHTIWELGDDEEELNIETSSETFGRVIPNLTTLKNLYEEDTEGTKRKGISHLEIIIDTSGSMSGMPLETAIDISVALIEAARKQEHSIALVTFSSGAWEGVSPSYEYDVMEDIILRLMADGGTNLRGTLSIIENHLSLINGLAGIFIISDTAIWDINRSDVKERIRNWALKMPVYLIAIADDLYDETELALKNSFVRLIRISPSKENPWEIVLDMYQEM